MPDDRIDPKLLRTNLEQAEKRLKRAQAELSAAQREVMWLKDGLRIYDQQLDDENAALGSPPVDERSSASVAAAYLRKLLPEGFQTDRPTLRQAILMVMRADVASSWTVADLAMMLNLNGWLPGGDHTKRISDMAGVMVGEGHLKRTGRGVYRLSAPLGMAMKLALPPIIDYRKAAGLGLPVPDHSALSGGLSDE